MTSSTAGTEATHTSTPTTKLRLVPSLPRAQYSVEQPTTTVSKKVTSSCANYYSEQESHFIMCPDHNRQNVEEGSHRIEHLASRACIAHILQ